MSEPIIASIITGVFSLASLLITLVVKRNVKEVHQQINSRMDELLRISNAAQKAEGKLEGAEEEKVRNKE